MSDPTFDRLKRSFAALVRSVFPALDYLGEWPAAVVAQNADGTLELQPDDRVRWPSLSRVPIKHCAPGVSVTVSASARVRFSFDGGDPTKPKAALFDSGGLLTMLLAGGGPAAARVGDPVLIALADISQFVFTAPSGGGPCAVTGAVAGTPATKISGGSSKVQIG